MCAHVSACAVLRAMSFGTVSAPYMILYPCLI